MGLNHKIHLCQKYNISKMSDFDVLSLLNVRSVKLDLMVNEEKTATFSVNYVHKKALILLLNIFQLFWIRTVNIVYIHFLVIYLAQFYAI